MKYAITGPRGMIFRVVDEEPTGASHYYVEITDEQAQMIEDTEDRLFIVDGQLKTREEQRAVMVAERQAEKIAEVYAQSPEQAKDLKRQEIASARYQAEISGFEINGMKILTDYNTQSKITSAYLSAFIDPTYTVNWKTVDGFVTLDANTIMAIGNAVRSHVQAQFDKEKDSLESIDSASTAEELASIKW